MEFNDLLSKHGFDPKAVLVMRHRPPESELRKHFYRLAIQEPELYNAYQSNHAEREERQLSRAKYLASFVGQTPGTATFIGLYENRGATPINCETYWGIPSNQALKNYGMAGFIGDRPTTLQFDLNLLDFYSDWRGRLVVDWLGGERSWSRWAGDNKFAIQMIREKGDAEPVLDPWDDLSLSWADLQSLWPSWRPKLSEWRGIYFVLDKSDGRGYVGSAYGETNLLGRWLDYAKSGHGGNVGLKGRDHRNFVFSILELVSPTMPAEQVVALEARWKKRLSTITHGLNEN
jgi:hypothetical protein